MEKYEELIRARISHANFRNGLNDYHDGATLTHQLGNDEYVNGTNLPESDDVIPFDGRTAYGNEFIEISEEE